MGDKQESIQDRLRQWLGKKEKRSGKKAIPLYVIFILLIGIILMIAGTIGKGRSDPDDKEWLERENNQQEVIQTKANSRVDGNLLEIEKAIQSRLKSMLENISGVSHVSVMINLQGTEEKVYEKNTILRQQTTSEEESEGGKREIDDGTKEEQIVIVRQGDQEEPILLYTKKPQARGVLVVAEGVDNLKVKEWVVEAVTRTLDIPPHKVSVLPRKTGKGE
ncbi:stage III sporulation protein AG [Bacillus piscicola]|uniref:stage III sporulation protein AG n=1 Tax=Bacillus piscicola TaxID=1632684 RepID=UPI001F0888BD|nr:stage III sporulation protein AG [Bacillus piscicola]